MDDVQRKKPPLRVSEFAEELGVTDKNVRDAIKSRRLFAFRLNKMWLIPPEELDRVKRGEAV
jgi:excisionase family DNA binding protein